MIPIDFTNKPSLAFIYSSIPAAAALMHALGNYSFEPMQQFLASVFHPISLYSSDC